MISFQVYLFFVLYSLLHPTVNARKNDQAPTLQSKLIQKLLAYMANTIVYEGGITYKADDKQKAVFEKYEKLIKIFYYSRIIQRFNRKIDLNLIVEIKSVVNNFVKYLFTLNSYMLLCRV
jgi:hypothetical protein